MKIDEYVINENLSFKIPTDFSSEAKQFVSLLLRYECAIKEITTKLEILDRELGTVASRNPISNIKSRIKRPKSIIEKLERNDLPLTVDTIPDNIHDVAGVRVICNYIDDIYDIARLISTQDDINVIEIKDYILNPKPNGYRSLHMIVEVPVFMSMGKQYMTVEIQIRTIAMDFWASLEHEIRYKKNHEKIEEVSAALQECAETIARTDQKMLDIRKTINEANSIKS